LVDWSRGDAWSVVQEWMMRLATIVYAAFLPAGAFFTHMSSAEAAKTASVIFDYIHSLIQ
jgi:hypothetical protein